MLNVETSKYIDEQRRAYALYVLNSRAIPSAADGLKAAARRVLWIARDGKKLKSASLAGNTLCIHPHSPPEDAINTLAAPYGNNIPLLSGEGAFGTLLEPKSYGATRYTSVKISKFTEDVMFQDIEIIPMQENYDSTQMEPVTFLPIVPVVLLNPTEGIAVGFATNILPRSLDDIIISQIAVLKGGKEISDPIPSFRPLNDVGVKVDERKYIFSGDIEIVDNSTCRITRLPFGMDHTSYTNHLNGLLETGVIRNYVDDSKDVIRITVQFDRGSLKGVTEDQLIQKLKLFSRHSENLTVINFDNKAVWNPAPSELIREFTLWRLQFYRMRYERLKGLLELDLQKYYDIRIAIRKKINVVARDCVSRSELKELLQELEIVNIDYIADLPVYRFTEEEYQKNEQRIKDAEAQLAVYNDLIASETKRKKVYISELETVLKNYNKGLY